MSLPKASKYRLQGPHLTRIFETCSLLNGAAALVAQASSLLYRRLLVGTASERSTAGGLVRVLGLLSIVLLFTATSQAQRVPHLAYVYPAGGSVGTTFQSVVGGQALATVSNVFFSDSGITASVVEVQRPMNPKEFNTLRERFQQLRTKFQAARGGMSSTNTWSVADAGELEQIRAKLLKNPPNRNANPAMADTVAIRVSIATNTVPGEYELRLAGSNGLSNPLKFCVGTLSEISKPASKPRNPELERFLANVSGRPPATGTPKYESRISLPAVVNGQIMPGGVDRYRFSATRGQQLVLAMSARELIPYLADAVPGWFESVLTVSDSQGKEILSEQRFRFRPDPVIYFQVPRDGEYAVEVHDSIFRGREDFVYRLTIGEVPFVTGIFPLGGKIGEKTTVTLTGWNLPEKTLSLEAANRELGIAELSGPFINSVPFEWADSPECNHQDNATSSENAQPITLPTIVNGRISKAGEHAVFKFKARAGQQIVAEVMARRLDSPLDSFLRLSDASGQQLAFNDDFEDKGSGLNTHHADSYLMSRLPSDGTYYLDLGDNQGQGGPEYGYRLRISEPRPDFALRVAPASLNLRTGMSAPLTVFALRRDGFSNAISLFLKNAPKAFSLSGGRIPAGADKAQVTVRAPTEPDAEPVALVIAGEASVDGQRIQHTAVPAEDMMQAFAYRHLVPVKELAVLVRGPERLFARDAFKIISETPLRLASGDTGIVRVSTPSNAFLERFNLELENPPEGITLEKSTAIPGGIQLVLRCDAAAKAGATGNLIVSVLAKPRPNANANARPAAGRRTVATLPAVPFEIREKP